MRRVTLMLAAMAVMVSLFAVVAYAAEIEGTDRSDQLFESERGDWIAGRAGADEIDASQFGGRFTGDTDKVNGNKGGDFINVRDDDSLDTANGGKGQDTCKGDLGDTFISCEYIVPLP